MWELAAWLSVGMLLVGQVTVHAAGSPLAQPRVEICLNGDWLRQDGGDVGSVPGDGWHVVRVPEYHLNAARESAWFRLDFEIPREFGGEGKRVLLRFLRIRHYAKVFLNGQECGENWGQRAPFEVDATSAARPGEINRLEVWVHSCSPDYAMPGKKVDDPRVLQRLCTLAGYRQQATIAEDVFLVSRPDVHVSDVLVIPSVRTKALAARLTVANESARPRDLKLANRVFLGSKEVLRLPDRTVVVGPHEQVTLTVSVPWPDARFWGYPPYGEPVLYDLETRLGEREGEQTDRLVTRFGFREVWAEGDRLFLNGKELRLLGYWVPEASGRTVWTLRMAALQSVGCNAIHNHAEQREPAFYDVADELGILVWDADYCGGPLGSTEDMSDDPFPDVLAELERQYRLWAKAVANHPSVVILMAACLLNEEGTARLAATYHSVDPTRLLHGGGGPAIPPMQLAAYASSFEMAGTDPLSNIKSSYEQWGQHLRTWEGRTVPLVNKEIWYRLDQGDPGDRKSLEAVAHATRDAIDYLREKRVGGLILYSQQAFEEEAARDKPITWPSRSGEGQHAEKVTTGGLPWQPRDFANFHDPSRPAVTPLPTAAMMREAGSRYLGHEVPTARTRRPEVIVTVTADGEGVPDVYVYVVPVAGAVGSPPAMRTDRNGTAWFALRDPGRYRFLCRAEGEWRSIELDTPLQPLDLSRGGTGSILRVTIPL